MTDFERERLVMLMEECAEVQKAVCKALRHGLDDVNPHGDGTSNRLQIAQELGDVFGLADILAISGTLRSEDIADSRYSKAERIKKWVHYGN